MSHSQFSESCAGQGFPCPAPDNAGTNSLLAQMVAANVDGLMVLDMDGVVLYANPAAASLFGRGCKQLTGSMFGYPLLRDQAELDLLLPDGDVLVVQARTAQTCWGGQDAVLLSLRDVTGLVQAREKTRREKELLDERVAEASRELEDWRQEKRTVERVLERERSLHAAVLDQLPVGVLVTDAAQGRPLTANQAAADMLGGEIDYQDSLKNMPQRYNLYRRGDDALYPFEELPSVRGLEGEFCTVDDMEARRPDGSRLILQARGGPLRDAAGKIVGSICVLKDMTKLEETQTLLEEALNEIQTIFNNSMVGVVFLKGGRKVARCNKRAAEIFGYQPEELLGRTVDMVHVDEDHFRSFGLQYFDRLSKGSLVDVEYQMRKKDGSIIWCSLSGKAVDPENLDKGVIWVMQDITELKEAQSLREDMERIAKHDMKTPLNAVVNIPQLLLMDENLTTDQREALKAVEHSGYDLLSMVNMSLDLYKMERGTYELTAVKVNVVSVIDRIFKELSSPAWAKDITFNMTITGRQIREEDVFYVQGDRLLCYSLLANLIKNALEASPQGETVFVNLDSPASPAISIHNQGAVPRCIRDVFFDKYTSSGKKYGTGLGTYSARLMAETMGGAIELESSEALGTRVTVRLPGLES